MEDRSLIEALTELRMLEEVENAIALSELDLWVEFYRPKTSDEWKEWEAKHGPTHGFNLRWKTNGGEIT